MNYIKAFEDSIKFATFELKHFEENNDLNDITNTVVGGLFRKIIELSTGVKISAENGLQGPAELNYRGLFEAYLAYKYITQVQEKRANRAKAYKVGFHKIQLDYVNMTIKKNIVGFDSSYLEEVHQYNSKELEREDFQDILIEYDKARKQGKKSYLPKWYSLNNGPKSINQLANCIEGSISNNTDIKVMATLYSALSSGAHNLLVIRDVKNNEEGGSYIKPVHFPFNPALDEFHVNTSRSLLNSAIHDFTLNFCPDYMGYFKDFVSDLEKRLTAKKSEF